MPSQAVFLASFRDGSVRPAASQSGGRKNLSVPPMPFLRRLLCEVGGRGFDEQVLASLRVGQKAFHAHDICNVVPMQSRALPIVALLRIDSDGSIMGLKSATPLCPDYCAGGRVAGVGGGWGLGTRRLILLGFVFRSTSVMFGDVVVVLRFAF